MERSVSFYNSRGFRLAADLLLPDGRPPFAAVVFAHGLYSSKSSPRNRAVAERLLQNNIAALLLDFTGHGESEGTLEDSTIEQQVDDLGSALDFLEGQRNILRRRLGVHGSSSGAVVALLRAAFDQRIQALVLRSPRVEGALHVAQRVWAPTLILAGELDEVVVNESRALYAMLRGKKRIEIIKGVGHLFELPEALERAIELTVDWFRQYLALPISGEPGFAGMEG